MAVREMEEEVKTSDVEESESSDELSVDAKLENLTSSLKESFAEQVKRIEELEKKLERGLRSIPVSHVEERSSEDVFKEAALYGLKGKKNGK